MTRTVCGWHGEYEPKVGSALTIFERNACPTCAENNVKAEREWRRSWRIYREWRDSGIPERYRNRTLENWMPASTAQKGVLEAVLTYAKFWSQMLKDGRGLVLAGDPGVGKTHLATAVLHRVIAEGSSGRFVRTGAFFAELKASFGKNAERFDDEPLRRCSLLVLDDVGASRGTEFEVSALHDLLASRYDDELPTILTTNHREIADAVGARIADRLDECAVRLVIAGESRRKRAGEEGISDADALVQPMTKLELRYSSDGTVYTYVREEEVDR